MIENLSIKWNKFIRGFILALAICLMIVMFGYYSTQRAKEIPKVRGLFPCGVLKPFDMVVKELYPGLDEDTGKPSEWLVHAIYDEETNIIWIVPVVKWSEYEADRKLLRRLLIQYNDNLRKLMKRRNYNLRGE